MWFALLDKLRAEYSTMSAAALILAGSVIGFGIAWLLLNQQMNAYRLRIEHLQDVVAGRLPPSTYKPIQLPKGRSVILGSVLLFLGLFLAAAGAILLIRNVGFQTGTASVITPALPITDTSPSPDAVRWNTIFGTTRTFTAMIALFIDGRGPDAKSVKLKDAFLESGLTGEVIKMKVAVPPGVGDAFPISEANPIPPKGFIRLVATLNQIAPDQGLSNKEFLEHWRRTWFNAIYEDKEPDRLLFDESVMESYLPEIAGPHVTKKN